MAKSRPQPHIFYKYHKLNIYLYELLINQQFYMASHKELNDPYDCRFKITEEFVRELLNIITTSPKFNELIERWRKPEYYDENRRIWNEESLLGKASIEKPLQLRNDDELIAYIFESEENETKFNNELIDAFEMTTVSFAVIDEYNDLPMWAYYSDSFKGVRLKFDFLLDPENKHLCSISPVKYTKWLRIRRYNDLVKATLHKMHLWRNESEYRITEFKNKYISFKPEILKEITFGYNVPNNQMNSIILICNTLGYKCEYFHLEFTANGVRKMPLSI